MLRRNNAMTTYNPFRDMDEFERRFFGNPFGFFRTGDLREFRTDIKDEGDAYVLEADLPGFAKEDIHLDVDGDVLTISAERHLEHEEKDKKGNFVCCERSYGAYSRQFDLSGIKAEDIKAKYDNGVLKLTLPKKTDRVENKRHLEIE